MTLNKDTFSFIRFINILQAKELNKGQIKYHTYYMRQTCKYKVSLSGGYSPLFDLKQNKSSVRLLTYDKPRGVKKHDSLKSFNTCSSTVCQCRALQVSRCQAPLKPASVLGSHTGRCLYEGRLYPRKQQNGITRINH